ncbi:hypothetical protein STEG23_025392 [Scotinomys teguina]
MEKEKQGSGKRGECKDEEEACRVMSIDIVLAPVLFMLPFLAKTVDEFLNGLLHKKHRAKYRDSGILVSFCDPFCLTRDICGKTELGPLIEAWWCYLVLEEEKPSIDSSLRSHYRYGNDFLLSEYCLQMDSHATFI